MTRVLRISCPWNNNNNIDNNDDNDDDDDNDDTGNDNGNNISKCMQYIKYAIYNI